MNKLRPFTAIGCPWHGRTLNDLYELGPQPPRKVSDRPTGATWGPAVPIKHPNAPGTKLQAGTDRDWGMYIGHQRSVNGADGGVGLGWDRWLYCDPSTDATWLLRAEFTRNLSSMTIKVYLDGVFGRFRPYPYPEDEVTHLGQQVTSQGDDVEHASEPRLLDTFQWRPDMPSWNIWGYTIEQVMAEIQLPNGHGQLAISLDGSEVFIHIYTTTSINIAQNLYGPTNETPSFLSLSYTKACAGICKVAVFGSSEAIDEGANVGAKITKNLVYEGTQSNSMCWHYVRNATDYQHTSRMYRTSDGDLTREWTFVLATGAFSVTYDIWNQTFTDSGTVLPYGGGCEHRVFAQNAIYVASYKDDDYFGFNNTFRQNWYGIQYPSTPMMMDASTLGSNWEAPSSAYPEAPAVRRMVGTYSPHNPSFTFEIYDVDLSNQPYTGTVYQWI